MHTFLIMKCMHIYCGSTVEPRMLKLEYCPTFTIGVIIAVTAGLIEEVRLCFI